MASTEPWSPSPGSTPWDYSGFDDLEELELCPAGDLPYGYVYIPALYLAAFAVGLLGNALVVWLLAGRRGPRRLVDTFVLHLAWAVALLAGLPSLFYRGLQPLPGGRGSQCGEEPSHAFQGLSLLLLLLTFVLPLAVTLFCYCRISRRLRRPPHVGRARRNSLRIIFAIESAFVGSWLPFSALRAVFHCPLLLALRWGLTVATCLAFVNSCANPLIYLLLDRSFRARARDEACGRTGLLARRNSSASSLSRDDGSVFWGRAQAANTASASW
uniref:G protein-coupled receptor 25 n=1 Tax=Saimiri boliviensis boliviensis TaxID=39432 RepID=A0A2K6TPY9_SAIBB